jgi:hypothetical protein
MKYLFKKSIALILVIVLIVSVIQPAFFVYANNSSEPFTDVVNHWAQNEILELVQKGIINGMGQGKFAPESHVTREQFIKLLVATDGGIKKYENQFLFNDLSENSWSYPYILTALKSGIVYTTDYTDNNMRPELSITRQETALMMSRMLGLHDTSDTELSDVKSTKNREAVNSVINAGLMQGFPDKTFKGTALTTRAQAAVLIKRILVYMENDAAQNPSDMVSLKDKVKHLNGDVYNDIQSIDLKQNEMTLNSTKKFANMKEGDIFYLPPNDDYTGGIIREIDTIDENTITFQEPELKKVLGEMNVNKSTAVSFENFVPDEDLQITSSNENSNPSASLSPIKTESSPGKYKLNKLYKPVPSVTFGSKKVSITASNDQLKINLNGLNIQQQVELSGELILKNARLESDCKFNLSGEKKLEAILQAELLNNLNIKISGSSAIPPINLGEVPIPVYGPLYAEASLQLIINAEGSVDVDISLTNNICAGFSYSNKNKVGFVPINKSTSDVKMSPLKLKAQIKSVFSADVGLKFAGIDLVDFKVMPGTVLNVEGQLEIIGENYIHGNLYIILSTEIEGFHNITKLLGVKELSYKWDIWSEDNTPWQRLFCVDLNTRTVRFVNDFSACKHEKEKTNNFRELLRMGILEENGIKIGDNINDVIKKYGCPISEHGDMDGTYRTFKGVSYEIISEDNEYVSSLFFENGYNINTNITAKEIIDILGSPDGFYGGQDCSSFLACIGYKSGDYYLIIYFTIACENIEDLYNLKPCRLEVS